jgi:hypothetical protein
VPKYTKLGKKKLWEQLSPTLCWYKTNRTENGAFNSSNVECVVDAAVTFLPSRYLVTIGGIRNRTHRMMGRIYEVRRWDELMCHDVHTKFHTERFRHSKVNVGERHSQTHWRLGDSISPLSFFSK